MKPKFRVKLDIGEGYDNFEQYSISLENVIPESLSAECPHCSVYSTMRLDSIINRASWKFDLICTCTHCEKTIFAQTEYGSNYSGNDEIPPADCTSVISIYPQKTRVDISPEVPEKYKNDYIEAVLVLDISPKASAALSRRILQNVLREEFKIVLKTLEQEIEDFIKLKDVPSFLAESVDAIRVIGNFAAHPIKYTNTGEIVDVEPGEAEWLLGVLEQLFDFAFIQPQKLRERKDRLNAKLKSSGKRELKKS